MLSVAVLALDRAIGFELMIPGQVFGMANRSERTEPWSSGDAVSQTAGSGTEPAPRYVVRLCSRERTVRTASAWGMAEIRTPFALDALADADIVIVPGTEAFLEDPHPAATEALREAADRGARIAGVCVGAFTVAAAGLLDGLRATTHWRWAGEFARRHPSVEVDPSVLFVDNGKTLTSAGIAAGIDLCLHLIRSDVGAEVAARTARRLVVPAWRDGGQAQYIEHQDPSDPANPLQSTVEWMERNASTPLDLQAIANHASMSVRSLNRKFRAQLGTTPQKLLLQMRVDRARRLLESTNLSLGRIAKEAGFGTYASLRYHFVSSVGIAPQAYRATYAVGGLR